jgi:hypothetical protein
MEYGRRRSFLLQLSLAAMIVMMMLMNMEECSAVQHLVGDDKGWDPHSNFHGWASRKIFRVGDNLWFAYASGDQSVLELKSRDEWEACDISNPIRLYKGGVDSVPLANVGSRFFSSGRVEDCQNGMKLHINVESAGSSSESESKSQSSWPLMERMKGVTAQAPTSGSPVKSHFSSLSIFSSVLIIFFALWLH